MNKKIKKRKLIFILLLFMIFIIILFLMYHFFKKTYSSTIVINNDLLVVDDFLEVSCNNSSLSYDTFTCSISSKNSKINVSSFSAKLNLGDNFILDSITFDDKEWEGSCNDLKIDLYTKDNKFNDFTILEFVIKYDVNNTGIDSNIMLTDIIVSDDNFDEFKINDKEINIHSNNDKVYLDDLGIDGIDFEFDKNINIYNLETTREEISINAISNDENISIVGVGIKKLNFGKNSFDIVVSKDGIINTYTLIINRMNNDLVFSKDIIVDNTNSNIKILDNNLLVSSLLEKIRFNGDIVLIDKNGNVVTNNMIVSTGSKLKIYFDSENVLEYEIIITGDVDGNGVVNINDIVKTAKYIIEKKEIFDVCGVSAADFDNDNVVTINDIIKLSKYIINNN